MLATSEPIFGQSWQIYWLAQLTLINDIHKELLFTGGKLSSWANIEPLVSWFAQCSVTGVFQQLNFICKYTGLINISENYLLNFYLLNVHVHAYNFVRSISKCHILIYIHIYSLYPVILFGPLLWTERAGHFNSKGHCVYHSHAWTMVTALFAYLLQVADF